MNTILVCGREPKDVVDKFLAYAKDLEKPGKENNIMLFFRDGPLKNKIETIRRLPSDKVKEVHFLFDTDCESGGVMEAEFPGCKLINIDEYLKSISSKKAARTRRRNKDVEEEKDEE